MNIRPALISDVNTVKNIAITIISEIYPHYYPMGAVEFFINLHNAENIKADIETDRVYVCEDEKNNAVGTVTVKNNGICRLFVLPKYQKSGYGSKLLEFAENMIFNDYDEIIIDASLSAKEMYLKRGYTDREYYMIETDNNDFLCYDVMIKSK